jgi:hypothetical protein
MAVFQLLRAWQLSSSLASSYWWRCYPLQSAHPRTTTLHGGGEVGGEENLTDESWCWNEVGLGL